jgi:hypothetical protein
MTRRFYTAESVIRAGPLYMMYSGLFFYLRTSVDIKVITCYITCYITYTNNRDIKLEEL